MDKVKVGIIGAGNISELHVQGYKKLPHVELVAVCDLDKEKAEEYAAKHDIPNIFTDYNEMLKMKDLDAVSVTTWNNSHAPISIAAMKAGKDVLCEKPLAMNADEAQKMVDTSKETNKLLMVGFVRRFEKNANYIKETIENDELGNVYYAKTGYMRKWGNPGGWFCDKKRSGGGPVIDLGVHVIDLISYLTGKPKAVSVMASTFEHLGLKPYIKGISKYNAKDYDKDNPFCDVEDSATALIKYDNGMTLSIETSWVLHTKEDNNYLMLYGDKAGVKMEPELEFYKEHNDYFVEERPIVKEETDKFSAIFQRETAHFIDCIVNNTECRNPGEDGVAIMKILDAIYESAKSGHEVIL
ncbi:Gfo/Idh/MocA family protein [Vallitalea guaymasensis]|uniref:Gfo/Idh/MocA family oxidoreductase n=1 Tax=Vallitalea guaymasensis TaxID=1185412 RepID=A0A8J8MC98_9FIRM|nr:Gfo/Idh/MocA family oxidoreductase [Vallitalea guaymasensis]QUH30261.1 Gfo/Idh/MocA family oxidoreductase [Vallitalea guaymasensis]